jgi:uncharacterized protein YkwD
MPRHADTLPRARAGARLSHVPTQRGHAHAAHRFRAPWVAAGVATLLVVAAGAGVAAAHERQTAHAAVVARTQAAQGAADADADGASALWAQDGTATASALRRAHTLAAQAALGQATQAASSSPHAGDVPLAQLSARTDALAAMLGQGTGSIRDLAEASAALDEVSGQVVQQEAAWAAAEQARTASEQAEAEAAAASGGTSVRTGTTVAPSTTTTPTTIPAGGKTCTDAGTGAVNASATAIGDAINAYRGVNGLPSLTVTVSGTLSAHAVTMADAGGIWHSGADNIVGCVSNGSAESLVTAWSRSAPHNAQMLRTDVASMSVGGALRNGWLYGAAAFR